MLDGLFVHLFDLGFLTLPSFFGANRFLWGTQIIGLLKPLAA